MVIAIHQLTCLQKSLFPAEIWLFKWCENRTLRQLGQNFFLLSQENDFLEKQFIFAASAERLAAYRSHRVRPCVHPEKKVHLGPLQK